MSDGWLSVVMGGYRWSRVVTVGYGIIIGSYGVVRGGWFGAVYECFLVSRFSLVTRCLPLKGLFSLQPHKNCHRHSILHQVL